jgi:hypothetical protein
MSGLILLISCLFCSGGSYPKLCAQRNDEGEGFPMLWSSAGAKIGFFCLLEFCKSTYPFGVKGQ